MRRRSGIGMIIYGVVRFGCPTRRSGRSGSRSTKGSFECSSCGSYYVECDRRRRFWKESVGRDVT